LDFEIRRAIVRGAFEGLPGRNAIWRNVRRTRKKLSSSSVTRVLKEFSKLVDKEGLKQTAMVYGVNKEVSELLEIARIKRENGLQTSDMVSGAKIFKSLTGLGIEADSHEKFELS